MLALARVVPSTAHTRAPPTIVPAANNGARVLAKRCKWVGVAAIYGADANAKDNDGDAEDGVCVLCALSVSAFSRS